MYQFIIMMRAFACLLITNSHQEEIYPIRILEMFALQVND